MSIVPFLREKIREGKRDAGRSFQTKASEDEGVAHGPTPNPDLTSEYQSLDTSNAIDRAFESNRTFAEDPSNMTQPGVLHGALNVWDRAGVTPVQNVSIPIITGQR